MWRKKFLYPGLISLSVGALAASPMVYFAVKNRMKDDIRSFRKNSLEKIEHEFFNEVLYFSPVNINYDVKSIAETHELEKSDSKELSDVFSKVADSLSMFEDSLAHTKAQYLVLLDILRLQKLDDLTGYSSKIKTLKGKITTNPDRTAAIDPTNFNKNIFIGEDGKLFRNTIQEIFGDMKSWDFNGESFKTMDSKEFISWNEMFDYWMGKTVENIDGKGKKIIDFISIFMNTISKFLSGDIHQKARALDDDTQGLINVNLLDQIINLLDLKRYTFAEDIQNSYNKHNPKYPESATQLSDEVKSYLNSLKQPSVIPTLAKMVNDFQIWFKQKQMDAKSEILPNIDGTLLLGQIGEFLKKEASWINADVVDATSEWLAALKGISNISSLLPQKIISTRTTDTYEKYNLYLEAADNYSLEESRVEYKLFRIGFDPKKLKDFLSRYTIKDDFKIKVNKWTPRYITIKDIEDVMEDTIDGSIQNFDEEDGYIYPKQTNSKWTIRTNDEISFENISFDENASLASLNNDNLNYFVFVPTWSIKKIYDDIKVEFDLKSDSLSPKKRGGIQNDQKRIK